MGGAGRSSGPDQERAGAAGALTSRCWGRVSGAGALRTSRGFVVGANVHLGARLSVWGLGRTGWRR
jgi:hypothetical protein